MNQAQLKLLTNFCADIAKGALLFGFGYVFILPANPISRLLFAGPAILTAIIFLLFALEFAKLAQD